MKTEVSSTIEITLDGKTFKLSKKDAIALRDQIAKEVGESAPIIKYVEVEKVKHVPYPHKTPWDQIGIWRAGDTGSPPMQLLAESRPLTAWEAKASANAFWADFNQSSQ